MTGRTPYQRGGDWKFAQSKWRLEVRKCTACGTEFKPTERDQQQCERCRYDADLRKIEESER